VTGMDAEQLKIARRYLDHDGRVTLLPSKRSRKLPVLAYLVGHFEAEVTYTELEVNGILTTLHTFGDHALLRRELYECGFLDRTPDGSRYWRTPETQQGGSGQDETE
jgi:hypothetical protein